MADEKKKQTRELKIEIKADEDVKGGVYANFMMVHQTDTEFTLDFLFALPQTRQASLRSRVILTPVQTKRLVHMLGKHLEAYEKRFGEIPMSQAVPKPPDEIIN